MGDDGPDGGRDHEEMQRSSRDHDVVRDRLTTWFASVLPAGAAPCITELAGTASNGMSSETLLLELRRHDGGGERCERLVARLAPGDDDVPVFPDYDMDRQFRVIDGVARWSEVPVPRVRWYEGDPAPLGAPFFVMDRVDGRVPPDVMPYNFGDSWLYEASADEQRHLQDATVRVLADLHAIDRPPDELSFLAPAAPGGTVLERRVALTHDWYRFAAADGFVSPLVERAFRWLDDHRPTDADPVLCWGDSRIGNVMYDGFDPVAVLDWEMATLGPRELDVAWLVYGHRIFEDIAGSMDLPGMPGFMRADDVATTYEALTGHAPADLAWYGTYAAVQYAIVFLRTGARAVHFGETTRPDDTDDLIMNREPLERMLAGTYWS